MGTVIGGGGDLGECREEGGQVGATAARAVVVDGRVGGVVLGL
jgi:hypothetical protein